MKTVGSIFLTFRLLKRIKYWNYILIMAFAGLPAIISACVHSVPPNEIQPPAALVLGPEWAHEKSDLAVDPDITFGRLSNGIRYILKQNKTPKDRVGLHLFVQTGSMAEQEHEQGIAHFIEHMLFDGSVNFAPGEMVKFFQRNGIQFGPDANAHTGFAQTVFDVMLPDGSIQNLSDGLMILKEYASGALLLPKEVEKERKVILSEKRSRDSDGFRTAKKVFQFEMPGSLVAERFPIGTDSTIKAIDAPMLHDYYNSWYHPERMTLVVVGDFERDAVQKLISKKFGNIKARSELKPLPDFGSFSHQGLKTFHHYEKEAGATTVRLETIEQQVQPDDNVRSVTLELLEDLAFQILQRRLDLHIQSPGSILSEASAGCGYYLQQIKYAQIGAVSKPESWKEAVAVLEQALRKALEFGFTESELARSKKEYLAQLKRTFEECLTLESGTIARQIIDSISDRRVLQSPQQRLDLLKPILESVTVRQVHHAFKKRWSAPHRLVLVTGNADLKAANISAGEQIAAAYRQSLYAAVAPPEEKELARFPYLPEPEKPGKPLVREHIDDIDVKRVKHANGFQMHIKKTDFKENQVLVALAFGRGRASEPEDLPGLAEMTEQVVNESGFGSLDRLGLEDALVADKARIHLVVREDMFIVKGEAASSELPLLFQLLHTFILDPGYRPEARQLVLKRIEQEYLSNGCQVEGMMDLEARRFLAGGDTRFGMAEWSQIRQRTINEIKQWFGSQLNHSPMELAVVGDLDIDQAVSLGNLYFGSLPERPEEVPNTARITPEFPAGGKLQLLADTGVAKSLVLVAYPTGDFWDIQRTRRLSILAEVFSERLRVHIREKLGAAYSPYAYNASYRAYPDYGFLQSYMYVDPAKTNDLAAEVLQIADQLKEQGISRDEFQRALDPSLTRIKDLRQTNTYWLNNVLLGAGRYPQQLEWCRSIETDYRKITAEEIHQLAQHYLNKSKAAIVIIDPKGSCPVSESKS